MNNIELAKKALDVYNDRQHWTYVQGGLGELSNSARIKGLYTYYRGKGNGSTCDYADWLKVYGTATDGEAKHCTDCSNFIQYLINSGKNAAASHYTNMKDAGNDIFVVPVGTLLLIPNAHVGIVTQQGIRNADGSWKVVPESVDFYAYNNTCRKGNYSGSSFTKAVYLTGIDYVTSPSEGVTPVKIEATVNGVHNIGETLQAKDFTIKITMSDGAERINPVGWYATPLKLTSKKNNITVGYQNVKTLITVDAIGNEPVPKELTASINGIHYLGDTLEAKDFTIKVEMSDGSIVTNPSNWSAFPLTLTENVKEIIVKYKGLCYALKVKYQAIIT